MHTHMHTYTHMHIQIQTHPRTHRGSEMSFINTHKEGNTQGHHFFTNVGDAKKSSWLQNNVLLNLENLFISSWNIKFGLVNK